MQNDMNSVDNPTPTNRFHEKAKLSQQEKPLFGQTTPTIGNSSGTRSRPKPMRQFDYSNGQGGGTAARMKMRRTLQWLVPSLAFLALLALGIGVAFYLWMRDVSVADVGEKEFISISPSDLPADYGLALPRPSSSDSSFLNNPFELREAYIDTFGGIEAMRNIRSMKTTGTWLVDGRSLDFQVIKKTPDMGAFSFESNGSREGRYLINGGAAWEVVQEGALRSSRALSELQRDVVGLASQIFDPLAEVVLGLGGRIQSVEEAIKDGQTCLMVEIEQAGGAIVNCYLDRASLRLVLEERNVIRGGRLMTKAIRYDDYRESLGGVRAHKTALLYDGELQSEMVIDTIRINTGVMSSLFRVPSDLKI